MHEARARIEQRAMADYAAACGQEFLVESVSAQSGLTSVDILCEPPAHVRVVSTSPEFLTRWNGNWLDPRWNVEVVTPHPALEKVAGVWVFGASYHAEGAVEGPDAIPL
jgi:hypothetical protein